MNRFKCQSLEDRLSCIFQAIMQHSCTKGAESVWQATGHKSESKRNRSKRESDLFFPVTKTRFPSGAVVKNLPAKCRRHRRHGFNPGVWKIPWRRKWHPLQYYCLENSRDRGDWQATVHGVTKSWMWLSTHTHNRLIANTLKSTKSEAGAQFNKSMASL